MKKKILLIAMMVAILTCIFVLSVSAETITYEGQEIELVNNLGDPSWYTGTTATKITDKESIVILKDTNGNLTAYPSYYVFRYLIEGSTVRVNWADQNGVDYSFINENDDKNYQAGSLYYVELPYGITLLTNANLWGDGKKEPNVVEFVFPDSVTLIQNNAFSQASACKKITMSKNLKTIEMWSFYNSANLETVVFPKDCAVESIDKGTFNGCTRLANINLENCTSLKALGDGAFQSCRAIDRLTLPDSIETIGFQALYDLGEIELASDYLPKSLKNVDQYFLNSCKLKNNVLYFPQGFTSLAARHCFAGSFEPETSLTLVFLGKMTSVNLSDTSLTTFLDKGSRKPIKLVFAQNEHSDLSGAVVPTVDFNGQKGFIAISKDGSPLYTNQEGTLTVNFENANYYNLTGLGNDANGNSIYLASGSPTEIIFCGGDNVEISYTIRCNHTDKGWYRFHTTSEVYDINTHTAEDVHYNNRVCQEGNCGYDEMITNTCVVCDLVSVVTGEKATGNHTYEDDFDCETALNCEVCLKTLAEALTHDIKTTIIYENGYDKIGVQLTTCTNRGCKHEISLKVDALFICKGYSAPENGAGGIAIDYVVNIEAIEEYERVTNVTISYGIYASTQNNLGDGYIFDENGTVADGALTAALNKQYTKIQIKLVGFNTDELKATKFAIGAYVKAIDSESQKISYLQSGEIADGDKYAFVSFNDIVNSASSGEENE
ncbi:MAG: leucine-rich repeat domain-containing protein [Ruminococcaceae bacterium]|nr:leucine-rich repeat domain-containing protein [Oscillospiraceae bacterium]